MGRSDKPLLRYSTSEMAKDLLEILDHLGWTKERELHISGVSMGGMIAQEVVRSHHLFSPMPPNILTTTGMANPISHRVPKSALHRRSD